MKKTKILPIAIMSSALVVLFLATTFVSGISSLGPLYTCEADPTVDGKIDKAGDWSAGVPIVVTLFDLDNQANKMDIEIMSTYGADYILYYGFTFADADLDPEDYFFIVIRTHEVNPIVEEPKREGKFGKEHDVKHMWIHNNHTTDGWTTGIGFAWADDPSNGGVDNGYGKCSNNGTHTMIEMAMPMNSGDTLGFDLNAIINGTQDIFIWYRDQDNARDYTLIRQADNDWDYILQNIFCTGTTPLPLTYVFFGIAGTAAIVVLIKRRRK
ncbi:MAG: hypothetical protein ACTSQB_01565 [Candidatus Heimdallarchaeota archaeon]